ncbi:MAG: peptide chain release factor-like protein [Longimicrobiales bacterium]|nr:peptide chain release factor-like protein [Longimicrobiales bacterium]
MPDPTPASHERSDRDLLSECRIDVFRAGGKGGQHQNTTNSGVRLTHRPTGVRCESRTERSQTANRRRALARLREKLAARAHRPPPRRPTRVSARQKRKRLEEKRRQSGKKRLRKPPEVDP